MVLKLKKKYEINMEILELAKLAGFAIQISDDPNSPPSWWGAGHSPQFEKFFELIKEKYNGN